MQSWCNQGKGIRVLSAESVRLSFVIRCRSGRLSVVAVISSVFLCGKRLSLKMGFSIDSYAEKDSVPRGKRFPPLFMF